MVSEKEAPPNILKPPENCPRCNGQTEWTQQPNGEYVAVCYFCAHIFRSQLMRDEEE